MGPRKGATQEGRLFAGLALALLVAPLVTAGLLVLTELGALSRMELAVEDALLELRDGWSERAQRAPDRVTVVRITESDLQRFGHPVPDAVLADALEHVLSAQPRTVGVDLFRDLPAGPGRERLAALARTHEEIVFAESLPSPGRALVPAPEFVERARQRAFGDVLRDEDGRVRRLLLLASAEDGRPLDGLALRLSETWLERERGLHPRSWVHAPHDDGPELRLGRGHLPRLRTGDPAYGSFDDRGYQVRNDFVHGRTAYRTTTLGRLLDGHADEEIFRDRAVLIGTAAVSVGDVFFEPTAAEGRAGVEIHALAVDQLLRASLEGDAPARALPPALASAGLFVLAAAGVALGLHAHSRRRAIAFAVLPFAVPGLLGAAALAEGWRGPVVAGALAIAAAAACGGVERLRRERQDRLLVNRLLESHVSPEVRDALWRQRHRFLREGRLPARQVTATVLFADLVASAEVAEAMSPQVLLLWLEDCMTMLAEAVAARGGIVDDYWGDGLKANFGALAPDGAREDVEREAAAAVSCALDMDLALARLNERWEPMRIAPARMRVGIHTGRLVIGSLGGRRRHKLTSVGDTVTVAARLESFLREDPAASRSEPADGGPRFTRILASEETVACLGGRFRTRFLGEQTLRGRQAKVCIHRVLGPTGPAGRDTLQEGAEASP